MSRELDTEHDGDRGAGRNYHRPKEPAEPEGAHGLIVMLVEFVDQRREPGNLGGGNIKLVQPVIDELPTISRSLLLLHDQGVLAGDVAQLGAERADLVHQLKKQRFRKICRRARICHLAALYFSMTSFSHFVRFRAPSLAFFSAAS